MAKWIVRKGWHTSLSNFWLRLIPKWNNWPVTKYKFNISGDNWYPYKDIDDLDINKFFGFTFGDRHKNSIRVGWTPYFNNKGKFTLYFYLYNKGVRSFFRFTEVMADTDYSIKILLEYGRVTFELFSDSGESSAKSSERFEVPKKRIGYYLWFYFGGNKTAPKDMRAYIKKI